MVQSAFGHAHGNFVHPCGRIYLSSDGDGPILPELFNQISEGEVTGIVIGDGAYYTRGCNPAIIYCQATAII